MKYPIEIAFATGHDKVSEFFVYVSATSLVMQLMTETLNLKSGITVIMARLPTSLMEFKLIEVVNEVLDDDIVT
jgi:hypothetical protein